MNEETRKLLIEYFTQEAERKKKLAYDVFLLVAVNAICIGISILGALK